MYLLTNRENGDKGILSLQASLSKPLIVIEFAMSHRFGAIIYDKDVESLSAGFQRHFREP